MKKLLLFVVLGILLLSFTGCKSNNLTSSQNMFSQTITIIENSETPKCKTADDISTVNKVLEVLSQIKKGEEQSVPNADWQYKIELKIDGKTLNYSVGSTFIDADGKQYKALNIDEIGKKLADIYAEINAEETDYK